MTKEEIIEMAKQAWISDKEAQFITEFDEAYISCTYLQDLTVFANLVAQHEREACAKVCEETTASWTQYLYNEGCIDCAKAIRARGQE